MFKRVICYLINRMLFAAIFISCPVNTYSWEKYEHKILANLAIDSALSFCGIKFTDSLIFLPGEHKVLAINKMIWDGKSFGNLSAIFSENDISQTRCHTRGYTIKQQLEPLEPEFIDNVWQRVKKAPDDITSVEAADQNVVFNYFLYHLMALRFAELSGTINDENDIYICYSLAYEAVAQSYLSDAFSAGHLLLHLSDFLSPLNYYNNKISHDFYCSEGVFVLNAQGDCWRTFGDKLMQWYSPSFNHVLEACVISLRELFLVYFVCKNIQIPERLNKWAKSINRGLNPEQLVPQWLDVKNGEKYYSELQMPALLCIPMPISATWSVRTDSADSYGIYIQKHYPQLSEERFHDPNLIEIEKSFMYSKSVVPAWMIPDFLPNDTLQSLIKYDHNIASVRYVQNRSLPPAYQGVLFSLGGCMAFNNGESKYGANIGIGWGFADKFLFLWLKPSLMISAPYLMNENRDWLLMADMGSGLNIPVFGSFYPRLDFGYCWGFNPPYRKGAGKIGLGFDSETVPLGFTYAGFTFRLKYQFIFFDEVLHLPMLEIILH